MNDNSLKRSTQNPYTESSAGERPATRLKHNLQLPLEPAANVAWWSNLNSC